MVTLPTWAIESLNSGTSDDGTTEQSSSLFARRYVTAEEMMALAIEMSARSITEGMGGPFDAAIFERHPEGYGTLVSVGVNCVVSLGNSTLHGEMVANQLAQGKVGRGWELHPQIGGG